MSYRATQFPTAALVTPTASAIRWYDQPRSTRTPTISRRCAATPSGESAARRARRAFSAGIGDDCTHRGEGVAVRDPGHGLRRDGNRRENLRVVTPGRNQVNRKHLNKNNRSGIRGVQQTGQSALKPWRAQLTVNRKNLHLGLFATEEEAVAARRSAELDHYGDLCP